MGRTVSATRVLVQVYELMKQRLGMDRDLSDLHPEAEEEEGAEDEEEVEEADPASEMEGLDFSNPDLRKQMKDLGADFAFNPDARPDDEL